MARTTGARAGPDGSHPAPVPRRVLLVSAAVGDGHDADAQSICEQVHTLWPGSEVGWVDALATVGPRLGRLSGNGYLAGIRAVPWLYEFFYASLWRHRWFATASKQLCGALAGRRLAPVIEGFDPDLIASTHPVGTAGLAWLCRRRGLPVPVGGWVPDFAPHPFWTYPEIDLNLLPHQAAIPAAAAASPAATTAIAGPPAASRFRPGDRAAACRRAGLDPARPVLLVACGSLGLGAVAEAVRALLAVDPPAQLMVVCGRNRELLRQLTGLRLPEQRLRVLGWTGDLARLLQAADLLVTNDGCVTIWESLATGTPVVIYRPITAHGKANAALLGQTGLAEVCADPRQLAAVAGSRLAAMAGPDGSPSSAVAAAPVPEPPPGRGLWELADSPTTRPRAAPMRSRDALFHYAQTGNVAQQIGTVLEIGPRPDGRPLGHAELLDRLRQRVPAITTLRRLLVTGRDRPGWRLAVVDVPAHVATHRATTPAEQAAALDRFWTEPLPPGRPPWQVLLLTGSPDGRVRLAIKLHHCLGDGMSAIGTLTRLLDRPPTTGPASSGDPAASHARRPTGRRSGAGTPGTLRLAALAVRGLARLAQTGPAPPSHLNRPLASSRRRLVATVLPADRVSAAARAHRAHPSDLLCGLVAEALARTWPGTPPDRLRAMFPVPVPGRRGDRPPTQGNWTGAVALDLPLSPMPASARVASVRDRFRRALASGEPAAAALVTGALARLPGRLHRAVVRRVYTSRFMNVIVSYLPGPVQPQRIVGAPIEAAIPVAALADGVPLGVAMIRWVDGFGVGLLLDASLASRADALVEALGDGLDELCAAGSASDGGPGRRAAARGHHHAAAHPDRPGEPATGRVGVARPAGGDGAAAAAGPHRSDRADPAGGA